MCYIKGDEIMLKLNPPTKGIALEQRRIIIEEMVQRKLMNYEHSEFTMTDELMIARLNKEQKLSGQEIVDTVLSTLHKR